MRLKTPLIAQTCDVGLLIEDQPPPLDNQFQSTPCRNTVSDSPPSGPCHFHMISRHQYALYPLTQASVVVAAGANGAGQGVASVDSEG
jgi:hypothetical protein